jgi:hypothetical protein
MPHMPKFGNGSEPWAVEGRESVKEDSVYGHAGEQTTQVGGGHDGPAAEGTIEAAVTVNTDYIEQHEDAQSQMTAEDVEPVHMPFAMLEEPLVCGDAGSGGQNGETHGHGDSWECARAVGPRAVFE